MIKKNSFQHIIKCLYETTNEKHINNLLKNLLKN